MERGMVRFTNSELTALYHMALTQGCGKEELVNKLKPVSLDDSSGTSQRNPKNPQQEYMIQISEDEAEVMLDCLPVPSEEVDPNLSSSRIKIQQFITKCRFGDTENEY